MPTRDRLLARGREGPDLIPLQGDGPLGEKARGSVPFRRPHNGVGQVECVRRELVE
jgi:hypothetical protein